MPHGDGPARRALACHAKAARVRATARQARAAAGGAHSGRRRGGGRRVRRAWPSRSGRGRVRRRCRSPPAPRPAPTPGRCRWGAAARPRRASPAASRPPGRGPCRSGRDGGGPARGNGRGRPRRGRARGSGCGSRPPPRPAGGRACGRGRAPAIGAQEAGRGRSGADARDPIGPHLQQAGDHQRPDPQGQRRARARGASARGQGRQGARDDAQGERPPQDLDRLGITRQRPEGGDRGAGARGGRQQPERRGEREGRPEGEHQGRDGRARAIGRRGRRDPRGRGRGRPQARKAANPAAAIAIASKASEAAACDEPGASLVAASTACTARVRRRPSTEGAPGSNNVRAKTSPAALATAGRMSGHERSRPARQGPAPAAFAASSHAGSTPPQGHRGGHRHRRGTDRHLGPDQQPPRPLAEERPQPERPNSGATASGANARAARGPRPQNRRLADACASAIPTASDPIATVAATVALLVAAARRTGPRRPAPHRRACAGPRRRAPDRRAPPAPGRARQEQEGPQTLAQPSPQPPPSPHARSPRLASRQSSRGILREPGLPAYHKGARPSGRWPLAAGSFQGRKLPRLGCHWLCRCPEPPGTGKAGGTRNIPGFDPIEPAKIDSGITLPLAWVQWTSRRDLVSWSGISPRHPDPGASDDATVRILPRDGLGPLRVLGRDRRRRPFVHPTRGRDLRPQVRHGPDDGRLHARQAGANGLGVIFVVSGGWFSSHDVDRHRRFVKPFTDRGYTVFAVVHGSQPKFTIPEIDRGHEPGRPVHPPPRQGLRDRPRPDRHLRAARRAGTSR